MKDSAAGEVAMLKRQSGKDMVLWGSLSLAQSLIDEMDLGAVTLKDVERSRS